MPVPRSTSIRIANYKCFSNAPQGFDAVLPVNLIIGRNNSGKSALLDLVQYAVAPTNLTPLGHRGAEPRVELLLPMSEDALRSAFPLNTSGGDISGNHWEFAQPWVGKPITYSLSHDGRFRFLKAEPAFPDIRISEELDRLATAMGNPFANMRVRRLAAARDILPEIDAHNMSIEANGNGATRLLQNFINSIDWPSATVEVELLRELNLIVSPDAHFSRITTQQERPTGTWEVYLEEEDKGRVALTHSGSGIKTIILVLCLLYLVPRVENVALDKYAFAFEELENNLHPALQRRLLSYLRQFAAESHATFFLTTHSNVAIDLFAADPDAQIVHVTHDRVHAIARRATTFVANRGICDDLDVRASDLLQANGVVWVEGPSDRLYFNRWVALWSEGRLKEGLHYQCIFYGGRLLNHLSATDPDVDPRTVIKILRVNRNALVLIDSDRESDTDPLNETKRRIVEEVQSFGGTAWVTAGREVENYLPTSVVTARFSTGATQALGRFAVFSDYLDSIEPNAGKRFLRSKSLFAESVLSLIDREALVGHLDLSDRLDDACRVIDQWNGGPARGAA